MKSLKEEFEDFRRERDKTRATPVPVQERFEPIFRGLHNEWLWLETCDGVMNSVPAVEYTAADPNAKPLPQTCPFCGGGSDAQSYEWDMFLIRCSASPPCLMGPRKPTPEEAVAAWNSIRVASDPVEHSQKVYRGILGDEKMVFEEHTLPPKPADPEPLTEEWLRKAGLLEYDKWNHWRITKRVTSEGDWWLDTSDRVYFIKTALKTRDDARALCRLLGVTLKE